MIVFTSEHLGEPWKGKTTFEVLELEVLVKDKQSHVDNFEETMPPHKIPMLCLISLAMSTCALDVSAKLEVTIALKTWDSTSEKLLWEWPARRHGALKSDSKDIQFLEVI